MVEGSVTHEKGRRCGNRNDQRDEPYRGERGRGDLVKHEALSRDHGGKIFGGGITHLRKRKTEGKTEPV